MRFEKQVVLHAPREAVWRLLAQTDRLNRELGLPPVRFEFKPRESGGTEITASIRVAGVTLHYLEHPFEWVRPAYYQVRRSFWRGAIREVVSGARFESDGDRTIVTGYADIAPFGKQGVLIAKALGRKAISDFGRACGQINSFFLDKASTPYPRQNVRPPTNMERLAAAKDRAIDSGADPRRIALVARHISFEPPDAAAMIRPFALADGLAEERTGMLETCLIAARSGMLDLHWRVLCPACRGGTPQARRLADLTVQTHCESCNITFDSTFDRSVEVVFSVAPSIRQIEPVTYCIGGPGLTPHIAAQWPLAPGERRHVAAEETGKLTLTSPQARESKPAPVRADSAVGAVIKLAPDYSRVRIEIEESLSEPHNGWTLLNESELDVILRLERAAWTDDAATAAHVTSLQAFRDQFSSEVLAPGTELSVRQVCILFSDLKDSTARYREHGDAPSYRAVRDHFDWMRAIITSNRGAIVKTAGDAVMACFHDPADGLSAAICVQRGAPQSPSAFVIKLGLHWGPALVVTANDRLDYFGQTVNLASRLQAASTGGDIVLTANTAGDPIVQRIVSELQLSREPFEQQVRGLEEAVQMVRLRL